MRIITSRMWQDKQRHGYADVRADGTRWILAMDKRTGATISECVEVDEGWGRAIAQACQRGADDARSALTEDTAGEEFPGAYRDGYRRAALEIARGQMAGA